MSPGFRRRSAHLPLPSCAARTRRSIGTITRCNIWNTCWAVYESGNARPEALWATWYHDVVYRPGQGDNEQRSAEHARAALTPLGIAEPVIARTEQIILATRSHTFAGTDPVLQGVLDADMAILGTPPDRYRQYREQVRREFRRLSDPVFGLGRRHFLEQVLAQPRIFATEWFWQRFEAQARTNLASELASG